MAHSLKCQVCSKTATVHLTQIVNNKIHKVDLCEACAQAKGVTDPAGFSLADLLVKSVGGSESVSENFSCPTCGFTQANLKKIGRLGCPDCWSRFSDPLDTLLASMHRGTRHTGRIPSKLLARRRVRDRLVRLRTSLQEAIAAERYEDAARHRDEIAQIQNSLEGRAADASV